jgi:two-component system, NarL family, nitrate/nitrite response regulator NarL
VPEGPPATAVVADDHPLYREGLVRLFADDPRIEVVAEAEDGAGALVAIGRHRPDVAVLDLGLPGIDGIAVLEAVLRDDLPTRVVIVSASRDSGAVFRAMSTGAYGYLAKSAAGSDIVEAVLAAAAGEVVIPRELQTGLAQELRMRRDVSDRPILSPKEIEVLQLAADGLTVDAIGKNLFISTSTVKTHLQNIYEKLGVSDRTAAVARAMRQGILS